jgi:hypothetical protein
MKNNKKQWIYSVPNGFGKLESGPYLVAKRSFNDEMTYYLDFYFESQERWTFKHPGESYYAVIPFSNSDVSWKNTQEDGNPTNPGMYMIMREHFDSAWIMGYGSKYIDTFDPKFYTWQDEFAVIVEWGEIPFVDQLLVDSIEILTTGK